MMDPPDFIKKCILYLTLISLWSQVTYLVWEKVILLGEAGRARMDRKHKEFSMTRGCWIYEIIFKRLGM